jgi:hypothetical protein
MVQWRKSALKQTVGHNLDLERIQFEKDKGNILRKHDYVNKETKTDDANLALGQKEKRIRS